MSSDSILLSMKQRVTARRSRLYSTLSPSDEHISNINEEDNRETEPSVPQMKRLHNLHASKIGLHPNKNKVHQPIIYHPEYSFPEWPSSHTFPMDKFKRLAQNLSTNSQVRGEENPAVIANERRSVEDQDDEKHEHMYANGIEDYADFFQPLNVGDIPIQKWFEPVIQPRFLHRFLSRTLSIEEKRRIGFREQTDREELVNRTVLEVAGTVLACQLASRFGLATNAAGGTHHAFGEMGAGYCILNDLAVASHFLLNNEDSINVDRVLVVDCDVHQGGKLSHLSTSKSVYIHYIHGKLTTLPIPGITNRRDSSIC